MKKCNHLKLISLTISMSILSACAVGPNYVRPSAPISANYKEAKNWKVAQPRDHLTRGDWWKTFNDNKLNELETQLNHSNQSIRVALANYAQALALVDEARANYFPTLSATADATRERTVSGASSTTNSSNTTNNKSTTHVFTEHSLAFNSTWEIDIWGKVRRQVEANAASAEASADLYAATKLSEQASLAQIYFELRGVDADQRLLNQTVLDYKKILHLTKNQYAAGVVSDADVIQAKSQLEAAQALAINIGIARSQYEHAIAVLMGLPPAEFNLSSQAAKSVPPKLPIDLPSDLLERRPDVAQAERQMAAANAEIGVAKSAYFPALNILAASSVVGTGLAHWFSLPMMAWSYGPQLSQSIIDGGLARAEVRAAKAGYVASVATYRQTVLTALQDVEDNLAATRILANEAVIQNRAAADAKQALRLVLNQYKAGTVAYSSVIVAQINAYQAEKNAADIRYQRMTTAVALIKAMGGGWDAAAMRCATGRFS